MHSVKNSCSVCMDEMWVGNDSKIHVHFSKMHLQWNCKSTQWCIPQFGETGLTEKERFNLKITIWLQSKDHIWLVYSTLSTQTVTLEYTQFNSLLALKEDRYVSAGVSYTVNNNCIYPSLLSFHKSTSCSSSTTVANFATFSPDLATFQTPFSD